ncbi:helix-turn-helix domain-containing protein [Sphingobacterium lumbrici]|uniref:helix-turn-helix domain-containing protein n=1 Tax=Sphingobacterium lumbrici TaxID=2559600 RepID=UPI0015E42114|nr:helix-turn-helix transcriptional regulator [Sphingobacterium lumbrici]
MVIDEPVCIPVNVTKKDVHVFYLMQKRGTVKLWDDREQLVWHLEGQRAVYAYLVPGSYELRLSAGKHRLFSFYFDTGIFRYGADEEFQFMQPPLRAHLENRPYPVCSVDFAVDAVTAAYIEHICRNLRKGSMDNSILISEQLRTMHHLSRDSVLREQVGGNYKQHLTTSAKKIIEIEVADYGIKLELDSVAERLNISLSQLGDVFKEECGITLNTYKQQCVVEKAKGLLRNLLTTGGHRNTWDIAIACGFDHRTAFHRFFKRETGMTPIAYTKSAIFGSGR